MEQMTKEEAIKRMKSDWCACVNQKVVMEALLSADAVMIGRINAVRQKVDDYNAQMEASIMAADQTEFERLVNTYKTFMPPL